MEQKALVEYRGPARKTRIRALSQHSTNIFGKPLETMGRKVRGYRATGSRTGPMLVRLPDPFASENFAKKGIHYEQSLSFA